MNRAALEERLKAAEGQNADAAQLLRELLEETDGCTRGYITDSWDWPGWPKSRWSSATAAR